MIVSREIETFKLLPSSETDIAKKLNLSSGTISKITKKMIKNGLAKKNRQGMKIIVEIAQTSHAQKLELIIKIFNRLPLENILSYAKLNLIAILEYPLNKKEISQMLNISRQWTYKTIKDLSRYGIILKKQDGYYLNPTHQLLFEFAKEYYSYKNHQTLKTTSEDAQIIWQHGDEFLFKTKKELTKNPETAVTAFSKYDLPLLGDTKYYYNTERNLQITDIILHTILINPQSKTYNAYACLLYEKTKPRDIIKKARIYNLTDHIRTLISFIERQESEKKFLPTWDEYKSLAEQYEVR
jgi:predicted transcriptional regulator